jgi:hypothetical protein
MDKIERIIKYIENDLTSVERIAFEKELKNSFELRIEFEKYLQLKNETIKLKDVKLDKNYLDSIIPEFREWLQSRKSHGIKISLGYAFGIMLAFILSIAVVNYYLSSNSEITDLPEFTNSLNDSQRMELLENLDNEITTHELVSGNVSVQEIDQLINAELEISSEVLESYDIAYDDLIVELEQDEVNKIYNEILNRNF